MNQHILAFENCDWIRDYQFLVSSLRLYQFPSGISRSVNTGVPDFDSLSRDTIDTTKPPEQTVKRTRSARARACV
jgi:hypothetical protein